MKIKKSRVLVVDDDPISLFTLEHLLQPHYEVAVAEIGAAALGLIEAQSFDLIILDVILPDIDGFELCRIIKSQPLSCYIPIIFISAVEDTKGKLEGFASGGVDYVTKPFILEEVISRVKTQIDLHLLRLRLEERVRERTEELESEIGRRRVAEAALLKLSTAVIQAPLTIMIVGTDGLIEYVNPWFVSSTGYSADEVIGLNPRLLKSGYTTQDEYAKMWQTLNSGRVWRGEFSTVRKNGSNFWESVTMAPVMNESGIITNFIGIKEDITVRKQRDNELLAAKVKAEGGSKAKSDFLTMVSHELRTPLNAVIGFSEFMTMELHGALGDPRYVDYARQVLDAGRNLLHIVEQIIDLTQVEAGRLKVRNDLFELQPVIEEALSLAAMCKGVQCKNIRKHIVGNVDIMQGDQQLIRQILINIISNALIFTPTHGHVDICVQRGFNGSLEIIVNDSGIGISSDHLKRVLEPFEQAENIMTRSHEGLGLGLPLAKLMTEAHGGMFKLESIERIGTKVIIRFPKERIFGS